MMSDPASNRANPTARERAPWQKSCQDLRLLSHGSGDQRANAADDVREQTKDSGANTDARLQCLTPWPTYVFWMPLAFIERAVVSSS